VSARAGGRGHALLRVAFAIAVCTGLVGAGVVGHRILADEATQARAFVAKGQRALAEGNRGFAVLELERARWLAPRDETVRSALSAAGVTDVESVLPRALRLVTSREWSALAIGAGWACGLGVAIALTGKRRRGARLGVLAVGAGFVVAMTGVVESSASLPAIVTGADARLLVAPYAAAAGEEALTPGTMVLRGSSYDDFVQVEAGNGTKGWVRRSAVENIASPGT
jgi:hypothetical protein